MSDVALVGGSGRSPSRGRGRRSEIKVCWKEGVKSEEEHGNGPSLNHCLGRISTPTSSKKRYRVPGN